MIGTKFNAVIKQQNYFAQRLAVTNKSKKEKSKEKTERNKSR